MEARQQERAVQLGSAGPRSSEFHRKKDRAVPRGITSLAPFLIERARGTVIHDLDGNRYLDFTGGWGCLVVGHAHPKVVHAIQHQADQFVHTDCSVVLYPAYIELAERLASHAAGPHPMKTAFFNTGAEAVENAVKIARYHTRRRAVVVFAGAFHGRTLLTMTMTHKATPYKAHFGPFAPDVYRVPFPNPYRADMGFAAWKRKLSTLVAPEEVAAVVVEPVQGEGGFVVPSDGFLPQLQDFCRDNGIVLVADEVQSGIGRTGRFFASQHFGIEPDLMCLGKSLASGLPLSGVMGAPKVMDSFPDGTIGGTYVGNPVACRAGLAVLDVIEEERLLERAQQLGAMLEERFNRLREKYELIGDARGLGAMRAIELVRDRGSKQPASEETAEVIQEALNQGVILAKAGLYGNVIRMLIPLTTSDEELAAGLEALESALSRASR